MFGRGGGGKRKLQSKFRSAARNVPRPSVDASRTTTAVAPAEETYSLVKGNHVEMGMIIKLTPDLLDEMKRAHSQPRIKFHSNPNNPSDNVIDVGGKEFRFTWSREMGDLCDIYQQQNGMLVQSGSAWRKLNVQRVLDESTQNHVKMRSEEAERKSKSRKVTILDHGSSSVKNQMKALASAEATTWKMPFKQNKEPPCKKRKAEPRPGPPNSAHKHVLSSITSKGRTSSSPLPSAHKQPHTSASPFRTKEDSMPFQATIKEKPSSSEKGTPDRIITNAVPDKLVRKGNIGAKPTDLRSMLIFLLTENPMGMSLEALKKSVGKNFPNSGTQIKPVIQKIATYHPPGRYILKSGAEPESLQKPPSRSGSLPENNQEQISGPSDKCDDIHDPENNASVKAHTQNDEPANLNSEPREVSTDAVKHNVPLQSPDHYAEKKVSDNSEGLVATSSNSQSDSDNDSNGSESDGGSHSRSKNKSKSPVGSESSGSSSDSETEASSNNEGSDEEVDIMTSDDDKDRKDSLQASEPELSTSPISGRPDGLPVQNATNEKKDFHASEVITITENSCQVAEFDAYFLKSVSNDKEGEQHPQAIKPSSDDCAVPQRTQVYGGDLYRESCQKKSERSDKFIFDDNDVRSKKLKEGSVTRAPIQSEDGCNNEKRPPINPRDGAVDTNSTHTDSYQMKQAELPGKIKEVGLVSNSHVVYHLKDINISDIERSPIMNGLGLNLRREPSELELGELRDPLPEQTPGIMKQSGKKGSIKQSENKIMSFDYWNPNTSKERPAGITGVDPVKPSSANSNARAIGNHEGSFKSGCPGHYEELTKAPHKVVQCNPSQLRRVNQTEVVSQLANLSDVNSNSRQNEALSSQGVDLEAYRDAQRNVSGAMAQPHDDVLGRPLPTRESKRRKTNSSTDLSVTRESERGKTNSSTDLSDICKDTPILDSCAGGKKNRGTYFNIKDYSYCKYEKDKPELKGPIKDHSQYLEYVKEYREKYDSYFSINKILESERNEFLQFGKDLKAAKEKDTTKYYSILEELRESYRRCGTRHKRMKKVYVVLHRELETLKEMIKDYANHCPKA